MKFKLLINPQQEELVEARVHQETSFVNDLKQFVLTNGKSDQIVAYDDKDLITLRLSQISMITILDHKIVAITTDNKRYQIRKRIYQLVDELPKNFWRINKSSIVNRYQIDRFVETQTAGVNIIMKNGINDYVSRRCFVKIRKELEQS